MMNDYFKRMNDQNLYTPGSTSWSYTDNEPDTKYDHAWSIAHFSRKVQIVQ